MSLPLMNPQRWERMSWHARERWRAARLREIRQAAAAHAERYGEPDEHDEPEEPTPPRRVSPAAERIAEIEWLLAADTPPDAIAARLEASPTAIERQMYRAGRKDLASIFSPLARLEQRKPCPDCGTLIERSSARCRPCADQRRKPTATCSRQKLRSTLGAAEANLNALAHKAAWNRDEWGGDEKYHASIAEARELVEQAKRSLEAHERTCNRCAMRKAS